MNIIYSIKQENKNKKIFIHLTKIILGQVYDPSYTKQIYYIITIAPKEEKNN